MKKIITMMTLLLFVAASMSAQNGHRHSTSTTVFYTDNDPYYDHYYNDDYYVNNNQNHNRRVFAKYRRNENLYSRMSYSDKKHLRRLEKKLRERKRSAHDDGFISDRELRRVRDVEIDIKRLYSKYSYRNSRFRNGGYNYSYTPRGSRSCR